MQLNPIADVIVGENVTITFNILPSDFATGNITVYVNGEKYTLSTITLHWLFQTLLLINIMSLHSMTVISDYNASQANASFNVIKTSSSVSIDVDDYDVGETGTITVTVPEDAVCQVLIDINGTQYYANVTEGIATVNIPRLENGTYEVVATYLGDNKYLPSSGKDTFNSKQSQFICKYHFPRYCSW